MDKFERLHFDGPKRILSITIAVCLNRASMVKVNWQNRLCMSMRPNMITTGTSGFSSGSTQKRSGKD